MTLLAVDTSHAIGSIALQTADGRVRFRQWQKQAMHSEVATLELENLLSDGGIRIDELSHLAVNLGPGSFTGLRVGINLVRTLSYCLGLPVFCFNTLEALAYKNSSNGERIFVAVRAIQNFYYGAGFARSNSSCEQLIAPHSLENPSAVAGQWTKVLVEGITSGFNPRTEAQDLVQMLGSADKQRQEFTYIDVKPLYVRASEAEEKLKRGILSRG